jgi:hypothetical protein
MFVDTIERDDTLNSSKHSFFKEPKMIDPIVKNLGKDADTLLNHTCKTISKDMLHLPGPDFVDRVVADSDRCPQVLRNLQNVFNHGRLGGTGYLSILPVDQGIEHTAGASFAPNPIYFDPENIVKLAIDRKTLSNSPSRAAAMQWPRHWEFWGLFLANMPTKSPLSSRSTIMNC